MRVESGELTSTLNSQLSTLNSQLSTLNLITMSQSIVGAKAYTFALTIIKVYRMLITEQSEYTLSKQILRSGTAVGALCKEAEHAQSRADFLNKMNVALKEANETEYWLMLLKDSGYISQATFDSIYPACNELISMLVHIVKTTKNSLNK